MFLRQIKRKAIVALLLASFSISFPTSVFAQANEATSAELSGTRKQLATIVFSGLSGAILGLSTLSFYGRPQDHLSNIAVGFAFGVIGGAIFTTYKAATRPYEAYDISRFDFDTEESKRIAAQQGAAQLSTFQYSWNF
jgi:hypothetical protein